MAKDMTLAEIIQMDKAALHVHIDGSVRPQTVLELCAEQNKNPSFKSPADVEKDLCFSDDWDLPRCLGSFAAILDVLQDGNSLERVSHELLEDLYNDGVRYAEIRYGPYLHGALDPHEAVERVGNAISRARQDFPDMQSYQKLCALRNLGVDHAQKVADLTIDTVGKGHGVVAFDLAGNEYSHPANMFVDVYKKFDDTDIGRDAHAGEGPGTPVQYEGKMVDLKQNIKDAVDLLGCTMIGHGYAMRDDPELMEYVFTKGTTVVCCPTSSVHTKSISSLQDSPVPAFYRESLKQGGAGLVAVDADNLFLSKTTPSKELYKLAQAHLLQPAEVRSMAADSLHRGHRSYEGKIRP